MGKLLHNMDIQLCCFLAGIYVCMHLFGCQNKSTCFQKLKSSNVFYARAWQMMPVAGDSREVSSIYIILALYKRVIISIVIFVND